MRGSAMRSTLPGRSMGAPERELVDAARHEDVRAVEVDDRTGRLGVLVVEEAERADVLREGVGDDADEPAAQALLQRSLERVVPELADVLAVEGDRAELRVRELKQPARDGR